MSDSIQAWLDDARLHTYHVIMPARVVSSIYVINKAEGLSYVCD